MRKKQVVNVKEKAKRWGGAALREMRELRDCFKAINLYLYDIIFVTKLIGDKNNVFF